MKQLLQSTRTGRVEIAEVPAPALRSGGVLIRTEASALSVGTERMLAEFSKKSLVQKAMSRPDLVRQVLQKARREGWRTTWQAVQTRLDSSFPVGYSSAGIVMDVGDGSSPFRPGDRVACGGAGYAAHAEIAFVPYNLCARIPENVPGYAAAFATIGAVGLHGLRLGQVELGGTVAVVGLGIIGQLVVQMARAAGLHVVAIDPDAARVAIACAHGAAAGVVLGRDDPAQAVAAATHDRGVDAAIITAASESSDPTVLGASLCRDRGRVVAVGAVGLDVPRKLLFEKELEVVVSRSYGPGRYDPVFEEHGIDYPIGYVRWTEQRNLETFVRLIADGALHLDPLITHRFPIVAGEDAYGLITGARAEPFLGVVLTYDVPTNPAAPPSRAVRVGAPALGRNRAGRVGIGVIGAGNFARNILFPRLAKLPFVDRVAVASAGGVSARDAARDFGFTHAVAGTADLLAMPEVECVIIETRHHLHAELAAAALTAGKAVFVEKPLALDPVGLAAVAAAWQAAGRPPATVGFNRRFAPMIGAVREFQDRRAGPWSIVLTVNAGAIPATSWVVDPDIGGGRLLGEGCHFLDLAQHLAGAWPVEIHATAATPEEGIRNGDSVVSMRFADGSTAAITYATRGSRAAPKEYVSIVGGDAVAVVEDYRRLTLTDADRRRVTRDRMGQDKGHAACMAEFLRAVADRTAPPIPFEDLLISSHATILAVEALRTGRPQALDGAALLEGLGVA